MIEGRDAPGYYTGRRRADTHRQPRIVFVSVLIVVAVIVVAMRGLSGDPDQHSWFTAGDATEPVVPTLTGMPASPPQSSSVPQSPGPSHSGSPRPSPSASGTSPAPAASPSVSPAVSPSAQSSPSASPAGTTSRSYEAESAENGRPRQMTIRAVADASGGRAVTGIGNGRTLSFTGVAAERSGYHTVTIAYLSTEDRRCYVGIGRNWQQVSFPASGAWDRIATVTITLQLGAGTNTIEAGNTPGRWCPDLDRITVAPR
ncbi:hypothetical protein [Dactylosporangium fulvum]|uniref:CBM6 domain-containing protein n=1 Tax=Dactylosporangium fulvum TaxID=53359 RepID=A0ABY5VZ25_9ACTN|nr:hypothetical protein [Dactylosporangium fulvum]UWP81748.1 hypothetical protein Dfulv_42725 [Dactylosporangium fulvum]